MAFSLAHLSDVHLGPLPIRVAWPDFRLKRMVGATNWRLRRWRMHDNDIAAAIAADVVKLAPDHVAVTGDIVNLAADNEFPLAAEWLAQFGSSDTVSFVPGNHDCYVKASWENGLGYLAPYMMGEMRIENAVTTAQVAAPFPYVRLRRNIALIGLNTGLPQPLLKAAGLLGTRQIEILRQLLRDLREKGYFRCVMIHHPPLPGLCKRRKALIDARFFADAVAAEGAELILHGHNHRHMLNHAQGPQGPVPVIGVPAASATGSPERDYAAWYRYNISRESGRWLVTAEVRSWNPSTGEVERLQEFSLSP